MSTLCSTARTLNKYWNLMISQVVLIFSYFRRHMHMRQRRRILGLVHRENGLVSSSLSPFVRLSGFRSFPVQIKSDFILLAGLSLVSTCSLTIGGRRTDSESIDHGLMLSLAIVHCAPILLAPPETDPFWCSLYPSWLNACS